MVSRLRGNDIGSVFVQQCSDRQYRSGFQPMPRHEAISMRLPAIRLSANPLSSIAFRYNLFLIASSTSHYVRTRQKL